MTVIISLVGEQPAPNLLPVRHYRPRQVVHVCTERTRGTSKRLEQMMVAEVLTWEVAPYDIALISAKLEAYLKEHQLRADDLLFNLTGGTKPMALAAFAVAQKMGALVIYFQTEGRRSRIYQYQLSEDNYSVGAAETVDVDETVTLDDYLRLYLGEYRAGEPRNLLEKAVADALNAAPLIDEVLTSVIPTSQPALEVDLVIRCGNQIGVCEVKASGAKAGIDQLAAVADQRYLGTYVARFLLSTRPLHHNNARLAKAYNITVIELESFAGSEQLSEADRDNLVQSVLSRLRR